LYCLYFLEVTEPTDKDRPYRKDDRKIAAFFAAWSAQGNPARQKTEIPYEGPIFLKAF